MVLHPKTLEKLRNLINEEIEYRSGPKLVAFFKDLGFKDSYCEEFPSRWKYTDEKLSKINGTAELQQCIANLFAPINFIANPGKLDRFVEDFNKFLIYDNWKIIREGAVLHFTKANETPEEKNTAINEFLKKEFDETAIGLLNLDEKLTETLKLRILEIKKCLLADASLSVIFLCGSTLEGVLSGLASKNIRLYNTAASAPKKDGRVKSHHEWTLANLIEVSCEIGYIKEDVKKFSHSLRDFRNYIHPNEQVKNGFSPDHNTSKISWQILKAAIQQINHKINYTALL